MLVLDPRTQTAKLRVYVDEPFSELEQAILRGAVKEAYRRRFGDWPRYAYVNTNWSRPAKVADGELEDAVIRSELPDELLEAPELEEEWL